MKKILLTFLLGMVVSFCHSQEKFLAIKAGGTLSTVRNVDGNFIPGYHIGAYSSAKFMKPESNFYFQTGVTYTQAGYAINSLKNKLQYYSIPMQLKYYTSQNFSLLFGGQLNLINKAKIVSGGNDFDIKDEMSAFDAGLRGGVNYEINSFVVGLEYYHGLTSIYKNIEKARNSFFQLNIGFKIIREDEK